MNWIFLLILVIFIKITFFNKKKRIRRKEKEGVFNEEDYEEGKEGFFIEEYEEEEVLPYFKKNYLLTRAENSFFKILEEVVGEQYYIFPQLSIDKLVLIERSYSYNYSFRNRINRKSVDFVLFDKQNISPVLVIELDDFTHEREDRKERDLFVNKLFNHCGVPILRVDSIPKKEELGIKINTKINNL